jgi:hypothetical protein
MTVQAISEKTFLKAMTLPDNQRREMLESLGAKLMSQFRAETEIRKNDTSGGEATANGN